MKVLIAGGTGFIGSRVAEMLRPQGAHVTILSRHSPADPSPYAYIQGDVTEPSSLQNIKDSFDCVIICVQFPNHPVENPGKGWTYELVDGQGTENLCQVLAHLKIGKIIYVSGAGTGPDKKQSWFKAKWRAEQAVKEACKKNGASYVIFRPSWIYGPKDRSMSRFIKMARMLPALPVIGDGQYRMAPIFIDDFAQCVTAACGHEAVKNVTLDVGGPQILTMNQVMHAVARSVGKKKALIHQPTGLMKFVGSAMQAVLPRPLLSPQAVEFLTQDIPVDGKPVQELLGLHFRTLDEGLSQYAKYE